MHKLPKNVAEAIEYFRNKENLNNSEIVWQVHQVDQNLKHGEVIRDYAADNYDDFLRALVNGYEIEETPEDKVRDLVTKWRDTRREHGDNSQVVLYDKYGNLIYAAVTVLDLLNIKIEGVNA